MGYIIGFFKFTIFLVIIAFAAYGGYYYGQMSLQKNLFEVEVPINENFSFSVSQKLDFPVIQEIEFPINENFLIEEDIPANTTIKIPINVGGQNVINEVPINTTIKINKTFVLNKTIKIRIEKNITIPIEKDFVVPIEGSFKTHVPIPDWMKH